MRRLAQAGGQVQVGQQALRAVQHGAGPGEGRDAAELGAGVAARGPAVEERTVVHGLARLTAAGAGE